VTKLHLYSYRDGLYSAAHCEKRATAAGDLAAKNAVHLNQRTCQAAFDIL
jgi:hypothetical protein